MGSPQVIAPSCASSGRAGHSSRSRDGKPPFGVVHHTVRHAKGFTVIGNHLAQHRTLSLLAIGLAAHIQSLPTGARIGIKRLTERFPESEARIAAALRELETHGYLKRSRERLPNGSIVTRTAWFNQPAAAPEAAAPPGAGRAKGPREPEVRPEPPEEREPSTARCREPRAVSHAPLIPAAAPGPVRPSAPQPGGATTTAPDPLQEPAAAPVRVSPPPLPVVHVPAPTARKTPPPPLPQPRTPTPELLRTASALLADLRRHASQLVLTEADIRTLTDGVAAWLEREVPADTVRRTPTADLPVPLKHPAKLLRHRITALLPPSLPDTGELVRVRPGFVPLQECPRCDRAFRSRHAGHCGDCRADQHDVPAPAA
ncbi:helix-turn-helix domain-containing protein [uncultured Streptomyces sp.]|uniref:helix-turn-helix domain-containing protein n=1 Tax=uncultured Streptomyces sp. TaxID=174707 RepID=UPI00262451D2|nr:helix-turn-helix domain-containing protein [uncultured Streptomyces sp.]